MTDAGPVEEVEARFSAALRQAGSRVSLLCDADGIVLAVTGNVTDLTGYHPDELVGTEIFEWYADPAHQAYSRAGFASRRESLKRTAAEWGVVTRTVRVRRRDGGVATVEATPTPLRVVPEVQGVLLEWVPIPDRTPLADAVDAVALGLPAGHTLALVARLVESMFAEALVGVAALRDGVWDAVVLPAAAGAEDLPGLLPGPEDPGWDVSWRRVEPALPPLPGTDQPLEVAAIPLRITAHSGLLGALLVARHTVHPVSVFSAPATNLLQVALRMATLTLASELATAELRAAAECDPLTGAANRSGLERHAAALAADGSSEVTLLFIDLDDFKLVNDRYGHEAGDRVLVEVAERIRRTVRQDDLVCRYGGDEFAVLVGGRLAGAGRQRVLDGLRSAMEHPVRFGDLLIPVRASIGIGHGPAERLEDLLRNSDGELYRDKRRRKAAG